MCEAKTKTQTCIKKELEESKTTFKKSLQDNNSKLCEMFNDLFKKYEYETNK